MGAVTVEALRACPRCGSKIAPRIPGMSMPMCPTCFPPRPGSPYFGYTVEQIVDIANGEAELPEVIRPKPARKPPANPSNRWLTLRERFPQDCLVAGPFVALGTGDLNYDVGKGTVDWRMLNRWAVPSIGVPVRVTEGNRYSGGYLPEELERIEA